MPAFDFRIPPGAASVRITVLGAGGGGSGGGPGPGSEGFAFFRWAQRGWRAWAGVMDAEELNGWMLEDWRKGARW